MPVIRASGEVFSFFLLKMDLVSNPTGVTMKPLTGIVSNSMTMSILKNNQPVTALKFRERVLIKMEMDRNIDEIFRLRIDHCYFIQAQESIALFENGRPNQDLVSSGFLQTNNQQNMNYDSTRVNSFYLWGFRITTQNAKKCKLLFETETYFKQS